MNKWVELLIGLMLVITSIALVFPGMILASWGTAALTFLKGGIIWFVIMIGLLLIILGISDLKE